MSSKRPAAKHSPKKAKKKLTFFGVTARLVMLVIAGLLALSYLSILVSPASLWVLSIFGLLFIPLALIDFILLVWAIFRRSTSFWIPLLALIPSFFFIGEYVNFHQRSEGNPEVKIVSYNVGRFHAAQDRVERSQETCLDEVLTRLQQEKADIICLQEFRVGSAQDIRALCKRYFPNYECAYFAFPGTRSKTGNVTLSRFPIRARSSQTFEESTNLVLYTDIDMGPRLMRVCNCHLESYSISLPGLLKRVDDEEYWKDAGKKMKRSITRRPRQVDQILKNIDNCPLDCIVCGDFNDTPMSHTYFALRKDMKDSFTEAGRGFGASYYFLWPLLRIDYILHDASLQATSHRSPHWGWSDHYPVIAEFVWTKK